MQLDARPEDVGLSTPRLDRVTQWMRRWVDSGRLPGLLVAVVRNDRLAYFEALGHRDVEAKRPVEPDTIYRIYSMTKPITTVAALMLYEEGRFQLDDPVAKFIPAFADTRVFAGGDAESFETEPLARPVTVHDLMTHTSGLTYGFQHEHPVDALYRAHRIEFNANLGSLAALVDVAAARPLLFQPGTRWNYGVSTDVLGRLVEIWSGRPPRHLLRGTDLRTSGHGRHRLPRAGRAGAIGSRRTTRAQRTAGLHCTTPRAKAASSNPRSPSRGAAGSSPPRRTTSGSCACSTGAAPSKASASSGARASS